MVTGDHDEILLANEYLGFVGSPGPTNRCSSRARLTNEVLNVDQMERSGWPSVSHIDSKTPISCDVKSQSKFIGVRFQACGRVLRYLRRYLRTAMVTPEASPDYRVSIAVAVEAIGTFTTATKDLRQRYIGRPNPAVACPALTELQHQENYAGAPDDQPVDNLISMIDLLIQAGNDSLRAAGTLVGTEPVFVWAHLPTGRAALEAFAFARWLAECPLDRDTRVKRGLLMRLDDAKQLARFGIPALTRLSQQKKDSIRNFADANGWEMSIGQMTIGAETLIDTKPALDHLFNDPQSVASIAPKLWSYLSGASHGNPYALLQSVDQDGGESDGWTVTTALVVRARDVHNLIATVLLGGINAWAMAARYFGWDTTAAQPDLVPVHHYLERTARALAADAAAARL
jgi:hypothetical protein